MDANQLQASPWMSNLPKSDSDQLRFWFNCGLVSSEPFVSKLMSTFKAKTKPGRTDVDSYTIRGTNKVVRPGDCVLLRPADSDNAPCVARVEKLEADYRNNVKVHVRRYYRPEESIGGRRQFHGSKELFLSDHFDVQSAHTIEGKCIVHTFKSYTKLESVGAEDYFCRFEYKAAAGEFTPDSVAEYCKSEMPYNPDDLMVQCEDCKDWRKECSSCHSEITDRFRIQCAECSDFLLCSECYIRGAEVTPHKSSHSYTVPCSFCRRGRLSCPGICSDWDSDAERLLLEGLERYGPKKWEQVAHHVKTKTKEQCLDHFSDIYLSSPFYPRVCRNCYKRIAAIILWTKLLRTTGKAHDDTRNALTAAELSYAIQMWDAVVKVEEKSLERAVSRCKIEDAKESTKGRVEGEAKARSRPTYG